MPGTADNLRLRHLNLSSRFGLTCFLLTLLGGYIVASLAHLHEHYENRDNRPGLTMTDIKGAYHGTQTEALLLTSIQRGHPNDILPDEKNVLQEDLEILSEWLRGENDAIRRNYDNPDFAAFTPREVIEMNCLSCHSGTAQDGGGLSLEFWDSIQSVAFSNEIQPTNLKVMLASMHAHASTMAVVGLVVVLLACLTSLPRWMIGLPAALAGLGLLVDLGAWFPSREYESLTVLIVGGGMTHAATMTVLILLTMLDMWLPKRHSVGTADA